jgi:hypothetical protein
MDFKLGRFEVTHTQLDAAERSIRDVIEAHIDALKSYLLQRKRAAGDMQDPPREILLLDRVKTGVDCVFGAIKFRPQYQADGLKALAELAESEFVKNIPKTASPLNSLSLLLHTPIIPPVSPTRALQYTRTNPNWSLDIIKK